MMMKFPTFRYPRALALAARNRPLKPSSLALVCKECQRSRIRGNCLSRLTNAPRTGSTNGQSARVLGDMPEKTEDSPFGGLLRFGPSNPARKFFDTASPDGSEALLDEFQKRVLPILRACCFDTLEPRHA